MYNMKISIIVPIYNVEKYLDKCIKSIVNQSFKNLEIILVDDGSPDNCPAICDEWAIKDSRIKVIHKENGGLSDARNAGLAVATGEYIAFVDSDDYIEADMYKKLLSVALNNKCDIVSCKLRMVYENDKNFVTKDDSEDLIIYSTEDAMSALIDDKIRQVVRNKIYKADIIKNIPFDVGKYHEDEFWSYQAIGNATKIATIDYTGYNYLPRSGSIMGNGYSLKRLDAVEAKCLRQEYLDNNVPVLSQQGLINLIFTCIYHGQLSLKYLDKKEKKNALNKLKKIIKKNISVLSFDILSKKQKIWIYLLKISFFYTCKFRNIIRIGI